MSDADEDLLATAEEFQATLTQRILPQLAEAKALLDKQQADLKVLRSLEVDLKKLQKDGVKELRLLKDIGCGVRMQAEVPDTSRVYIGVGLGFYVEATLDEATKIAATQIKALEQLVTEAAARVGEIEYDAQLFQEGISSIQQGTV